MMMDTDSDPSELNRVRRRMYRMRTPFDVHPRLMVLYTIRFDRLGTSVRVSSTRQWTIRSYFRTDEWYLREIFMVVRKSCGPSCNRCERVGCDFRASNRTNVESFMSGPTIAVDGNKTTSQEDLERLRRQSSINTNVVREATEHTYSLSILMPRGRY